MPVYYVIVENVPQYNRPWRAFFRIVAVFETTDDKTDDIWQSKGYGKMQYEGRNLQSFTFMREPKPLFKEWFEYHLEGEKWD